MSASCYTHRIKVKTQARNAKVQYPGRLAMFDGIHATCATNPDYTILNYTDIRTACSKGKDCIIINPIVVNPCLPIADQILNGQFSSQTTGCILNGGFSNSNFTTILDGESSCSILQTLYDGTTSLNNNYTIFNGGSSTSNLSNVLDAGNSFSVC
jgi:hypothetical protein